LFHLDAVVEQNQEPDDLSDRPGIGCGKDNSVMLSAGCVKAEKIGIICKNDPLLDPRELQLLFVRGATMGSSLRRSRAAAIR
jgi:hypothetical protein